MHILPLNMESSLGYRQICLEKSDENKTEKCRFLAWFGKFKVHFCKIIDV